MTPWMLSNLKKIQAAFIGDACPWFFRYGVSYHNDGQSEFVHGVYVGDKPTSNFWPLPRPVLQSLGAASAMSIKANLVLRTESIQEHPMHDDNPLEDAYTAVYYINTINTNDGSTFFENDERVENVANRMVVFPSTMKHGGTSCTDQPCRIVVNLNYYPIIHA